MEKIDMEIDDFINYCDYKGLSQKTYGSYEQTLRLLVIYLKDKFKIKNSNQVEEKHLKDYIENLKERGKYTVVYNEKSKKTNSPQNRGDFGKKVSLVTVNNYIRNMRVYFNYMYDNRMIKTNPVRKIKTIRTPRKVKEYLDDEMFKRLLNCFDLSKFHEYRDYVITQLIFDTGMRVGECLMIRDETDINFTDRTIFLPADNTKGKKDIHPHILHNNFAKRFLMNGGDIYTLSQILGHSSVKVTEECYLDLKAEDLRKQYQRYSPLMNLKVKKKR